MSQTPWYDADPHRQLDWEEGLYRAGPHEDEREPRGGWRDQDPARGYDFQQRDHGVRTRGRASDYQQSPSRPGRRARPGSPERSPGKLIGRVGALPGRAGVIVVIGSAALGVLATVVRGGQPGAALGLLIVAGTAVGGSVVRPRASYLIIPVPAVAYLLAALVAGVINAKATGASRAELAVGALQWMAHGFVAMTSATILAIGITGGRWWFSVRSERRG